MGQTETAIIRAALDGATYRDIEIEASKSLYKLAGYGDSALNHR